MTSRNSAISLPNYPSRSIDIAVAVLAAAIAVIVPDSLRVGIPVLALALVIGLSGPIAISVFMLTLAGMGLGFVTNYDSTLLEGAGGTSLDGLRILLIILAFIVALTSRPELIFPLRYTYPYLVFLALGFVSLAWSPERGLGSRHLLKLGYPLVGFVMGFYLQASGRSELIKRCILVSALLGSALQISIRLVGLSGWEHFTGRYFGAWHPNHMGMFCVATGLPLLLWGMTSHRRHYVLASMLMFAQLVLTGSRTLFVAAAAALGVMGLLRRQFSVVAGGVATAAVLWLTVPSLGERSQAYNPNDVGLLPNELGQLQNMSGRVLLWVDAWTGLGSGAHLVLRGHGLGACSGYIEDRHTVGHVHNIYLEALLDLGVPGLCALLAAFVTIGLSVLSLQRWHPSPSGTPEICMGLLVAVLITGLAENPLNAAPHYMTFLWVLYGCCMAIRQCERLRLVR